MEQQKDTVLQKTVKWLAKGRKIHISLHDTSGILHNTPALQLPMEYTIHSSAFCDGAKTTPEGLRACLRCKSAALRKAIRLGRTYTGQCYLGLTEIVRPVYVEDRLVCVIFIGNMVRKSRIDEVSVRIGRNSTRTGVDAKQQLGLLTAAEPVGDELLLEYQELADILEEMVVHNAFGISKLRAKTESASPIYRQEGHWVVEMLQNYAAAYYNRDIRLSQLAKLYFLNAQYLCRLFRKETGTHFSEYVNRVRIDNAKHLLEHTEEDIIRIAGKVGFANVTYFNRLFRRYTGMNPGMWRKEGK